MLKITNFTKTYKTGKKAANNVSLEVKPGDIFGFIGHNGAGKTTLIKAIVGIHNFDQGSITIDGIDIIKNPIECKKILAYIPDNPDLYEHMKGIKYLNFICDMYDVAEDRRNNLIKKYAEQFEIFANLGDEIASYSHGMKQKLAIISAFIHSPKLLILDEPFVGLDPKASHTLKTIMKEFCDAGNSIFFSTHVLEVAQKLCNKVAIIKDGEILASGRTEEIVGNSSLENIFLELTDNEKIN